MIPYWPTNITQDLSAPYSGSAVDMRASFDTLGGPITRRRTTGSIGNFTFTTPHMSKHEFSILENWIEDDLRGGALAFCRRDPIGDAPRMWKIAAGGQGLYSISTVGVCKIQASLDVVRLPSIPWFADYIPHGVSRIPDFIADYENDVFGVMGEKTGASAMLDIAGEYFTVTTDATSVTRETQTLTAGDIPETAPAGVTSIIGYLT